MKTLESKAIPVFTYECMDRGFGLCNTPGPLLEMDKFHWFRINVNYSKADMMSNLNDLMNINLQKVS
jgi:hypothetical protein